MTIVERPEPILDFLEQADRLTALQDVTQQLRAHYHVKHVAFQWLDSRGVYAGCGTYPTAWLDRYAAENFLRLDPVISACFQQYQPVEWKALDWSAPSVRAYAKKAARHGVGPQGYSIPERGPNGQFALLTLNNRCTDAEWALFIERHRRDLILFAHLMNEKAMDLDPHRPDHTARPLSPREIDAMTFLATGHSRAQTASELSISEHTLRVYIESARFKLGALNTTHAVARALSRGLIVV